MSSNRDSNDFISDSEIENFLSNLNDEQSVTFDNILTRALTGGHFNPIDHEQSSVFNNILPSVQNEESAANYTTTNDSSGTSGLSRPVFYDVISEERQNFNNFQSSQIYNTIKLKNNFQNIQHPARLLEKTFEEIVQNEIKKDMKPIDRVGLTINSLSPTSPKPVWIPIMPISEISAEIILNRLENVLQSNETFLHDIPLTIKIVKIRSDEGHGRNRRNIYGTSFYDFCKPKKAIVWIENNDNLCLPRALAVGVAYIQRNENASAYKQIRSSEKSRQKKEAIELCKKARVNITQIGGGYEAIDKFQTFLKDYRITVFTHREGRTTMYENRLDINAKEKGIIENESDIQRIDLLLENNHYALITSVTGAFTCDFFCRRCKIPYHNKGLHKCSITCNRCHNNSFCDPSLPQLRCEKCRMYFNGENCLKNHYNVKYAKSKTVCDMIQRCENCNVVFTNIKGRTHACGKKYCFNCKQQVPYDHLCYVQKIKEEPLNEDEIYIFYDFECRQDTPLRGEPHLKIHIPNFCVLQIQCSKCMKDNEDDVDIETFCNSCGQRQYIIKADGNTLLQQFFHIIQEKKLKCKKMKLFAHNASGYDAQFLIKFMTENLSWTPEVIMNGGKIMSISIKNIVFKDTLNFFHAPLASLPKMFGIKNISKGYFPHFFNTLDNQTYEGPIPKPHYYGCDYMNSDQRQVFLEWWESQKDTTFKFAYEMKKYCIEDVNILRKATIKFRKLFHTETRVDPYESTTIASACMNVFRTNFLKENTVAYTDHETYRWRDKQSIEAIKWLRIVQGQNNIDIKTAENGREAIVAGYKVDGYCENFNGKKTVFQYHGCFYHGCPVCYKNRTAKIKNCNFYENMAQRYKNTLVITQHLRNQGYDVIEMWGCEFKKMCASNPELKIQFQNLNISKPLSPRDAFFGGRTEVFRKYYKVDPSKNEKIMYLDVNSLYPYVCKYGTYGEGHPNIYYDKTVPKNIDFSKTVGLAKIEILPPKKLLFPVLPVKINKKLIFTLCTTCAEQSNQNDCLHTDDERKINGTFTCFEICKALKKGYLILKVYEFWEYKAMQYSKDTGEGGIYSGYIDQFLKLKQEASGFPSNIKTSEEKEKFIRDFKERENVTLDIDKISPNSGFRSLAKLCLNSLWGKGGQRPDLPQTSIVKVRESLMELVNNPAVEVGDVWFISDELAYVSWKYVEEAVSAPNFTNVVIAAHVTSIARLYLYQYLEIALERALYVDTDSIFYIQRLGDPEIPEGVFLGELTNELAEYGPDSYISEFIAESPKNYSYVVVTSSGEEKKVCKIKGFQLNHYASRTLNFETMKKFIFSKDPEPISITEPCKIRRKRPFIIVSGESKKQYQRVPSKRRCLEDFSTLPYGY